MECDECQRLSGAFLESMVFAGKAEAALGGYFLTHQHGASVSELAEYCSMKEEHQRTVDDRDEAYISLVNHKKLHGESAASVQRIEVR
jgi:hypothetical protein